MWLLVLATALAPASDQRPLAGPGSLKSLDETDFSEIEAVKKSLAKLKSRISGTDGKLKPAWNAPLDQFSLLQSRSADPLFDAPASPAEKLQAAERGLRTETRKAADNAETMEGLEQHAKDLSQFLTTSEETLNPDQVLADDREAKSSLLETPGIGQLPSLQKSDFRELEGVKAQLTKLKQRIEAKATPPQLREWSDLRSPDPRMLPPPRYSLLSLDPGVFQQKMDEAKASLRKALPARIAQSIADEMLGKVDAVKKQGHLDATSFFELKGNLGDLEAAEKRVHKMAEQVQEHQRVIKATPLGQNLPFDPERLHPALQSLLQENGLSYRTKHDPGHFALLGPEDDAASGGQTLDDDAAAFSSDAPTPHWTDALRRDSAPEKPLPSVTKSLADTTAYIAHQREVSSEVANAAILQPPVASIDATKENLAADVLDPDLLAARDKERARAVQDDNTELDQASLGLRSSQWVGLNADDPLQAMAAGLKTGPVEAVDPLITMNDPTPVPDLASLLPASDVPTALADLKQSDADGDAMLGSKLPESVPSAVFDLKNRFETPAGDVRPLDSW